ncbi:hypothetical protein DFH29DRAFT_997402 [Suillus ampliporus]|nr:hypothetical protein DFH29DRAFT_997402 [Suillus ampliporus]
MATMTPSWGIDQGMELLKRSVPIWPTQLRWYTEMLLPIPPPHDYSMQAMQTDPARHGEKGDWKESIHPSGATYYYNEKTKTYTEMNIDTCSEEQLRRLKSWIDTSRSKIDGKQWLLVVDLMLARGEEIYPYYYVVPESKIITWVEPMDGYILFQECTMASHWNHKKALAMEQSTAATIFWTLDQMKEMATELAIAETLTGLNGMVEEPGVAICVGERHADLEDSPFMTGLVVAMVCIPIMVLKHLRNIYVDGLINGVDLKEFTDDFSVQAKSRTTVVSPTSWA